MLSYLIVMIISIVFGFSLSYFNVHHLIYKSILDLPLLTHKKFIAGVISGQLLFYFLVIFYPLYRVVCKMIKFDEQYQHEYDEFKHASSNSINNTIKLNSNTTTSSNKKFN